MLVLIPSRQKTKQEKNRFKARHCKEIAKGKMSAAYWANKTNGVEYDR